MEQSNLFLYIVGAILIAYLLYTCYLHTQERVVFFYSYLDIAITVANPLIFIIMYFLTEYDYINVDLAVYIVIFSTLVSSIFMWIITYRSNNRSILPTLFVYLAKIILGLLLLAIIAVTILLSFGKSERKKYERQKSYQKRVSAEQSARLAAGFGIAYFIVSYCCLYYDFSMPEKYGNND